MRRMLASVGGVGLAVMLSQFPEYAQQYTQRLGGAVDELRIVTADFDNAAEEAGLDRAGALERYQTSSDAFLADRGQSMERTFVRYGQLSETLERVQGADPIERFKNLPAFLDTDIGRRTLENYQPAVPVTMEGLFYAAAGFGLGYLVLSGLIRFCALPFRRRRLYVRS
ncbi:hypothetical protein ASD83_17195 [Devosia sp. Root685]|uniref:DUF2937 family protein n=1 Tax=Devosia sp. Root685 TaxID=1736587 RepID=UPI0006F27290|nr:DUF2937 family protein [Devosia sp. Root685]KRA96805.1 hypothetical protein ASD83_17195 [Devosia sp. Root685]